MGYFPFPAESTAVMGFCKEMLIKAKTAARCGGFSSYFFSNLLTPGRDWNPALQWDWAIAFIVKIEIRLPIFVGVGNGLFVC
jgi:hypothetical protein